MTEGREGQQEGEGDKRGIEPVKHNGLAKKLKIEERNVVFAGYEENCIHKAPLGAEIPDQLRTIRGDSCL
jgi:hypothetical protein